jgi:uncharacterized membrane protein
MDKPKTSEIPCAKCHVLIGAGDNFCRHCGAPAGGSPAAWWESPWVVLPLIFVVLGPLALPLLWRSRRFTRPWKIAISVIVVGITAYALWQIWYLLDRTLAPLKDLMGPKGF